MNNNIVSTVGGAMLAIVASSATGGLDAELIESANRANIETVDVEPIKPAPLEREIIAITSKPEEDEAIADIEPVIKSIPDNLIAELEAEVEARVRAEIKTEPKARKRSYVTCADVDKWNKHVRDAGGIAQELYGPDKPCSAKHAEFEQFGVRLIAAVNASMLEAKKDQDVIRKLSERTQDRPARRLDRYLAQ